MAHVYQGLRPSKHFVYVILTTPTLLMRSAGSEQLAASTQLSRDSNPGCVWCHSWTSRPALHAAPLEPSLLVRGERPVGCIQGGHPCAQVYPSPIPASPVQSTTALGFPMATGFPSLPRIPHQVLLSKPSTGWAPALVLFLWQPPGSFAVTSVSAKRGSGVRKVEPGASGCTAA